MSSPKQPSSFVWTYFFNGTGWTSNGIVFLMGLVNPAFAFSGIDGAIHLAEDCFNAAVAVPRALVSIIVLGFVTSFIFCVAMLYSFYDFELVGANLVPLFEIRIQATNPKAGVGFMVLVIFLALFAINAAMQTSSRLTWSFARDDALIFSKFIGRVNGSLGVPVYALLFNQFVAMVVGVVYVGSTAAFLAIIGSCVVLQQLSFCVPVLLLMMKGRNSQYLATQGLRLGAVGWLWNGTTVAWTLLSTIVFNFPSVRPVSGSTMSESCAQLSVVVRS